MAFPRLAGMILHPTSLPGGHGIGDLGDSARRFVDCLHDAAIGIWQVLPLGPTGGSNSPYQSLSSYAGNPLLISLNDIVAMELLEAGELQSPPQNTAYTDFAAAARYKLARLRLAWDRFTDARADASVMRQYEEFCANEGKWLDDFALFMAVKEVHRGQPWYHWPDRDLRMHRRTALEKYQKTLAYDVGFHKFLQFLFSSQWTALRHYASERQVKLMGDVPIYCAHDSADVWAEPEFFQLDADGRAEAMAGVPPDYFSATGQLWGNPLYDWEALRKDGYRWWVRRIRSVLNLVDILRIDHFRGFQAYWAVQKGETTAINGRWIAGPGQELFDVLQREIGTELPIVAEDLGVITPAVEKLRLDNGLPGMKVLHFAFSEGAEDYLPHTYHPNTVCYVATHDNDTTRGWYDREGQDYEHMDAFSMEKERDKARRYLGRDGHDMPWDLMRLALSSVADTAILLMQDVLNLPNACRMNRPGQGEGQWRWRLTEDQMAHAPWGALGDMVHLYGREPVKTIRTPAQDVI